MRRGGRRDATVCELGPDDRRQLAALGIPEAELRQQLELLAAPPPPVRLERPCRPGDGILTLEPSEHERLLARAEEAARAGRLSKFVPASGAATRMFQAPLAVLAGEGSLCREHLERAAAGGDEAAGDVLRLFDHLDDFAFTPDLAASLAAAGLDLAACRRRGELRPILEHLLTPAGLGYPARPKGLIPFHRYPEGARTPFEEQLAEGAAHLRDADGVCRFHFTVPPGDEPRFADRLAAAQSGPERHLERDGARFEVTFSPQEPGTDTVAAEPDGRPFRLADGSLHFRPGGHGALLGNLQRAGGDVVLIKNVDNVLPDRLKGPTVRWKKLLTGLLLEVEGEVHRHLVALEGGGRAEAMAEAAAFVGRVLEVPVPEGGGDEVRRFLVDRLDRPLRVCGMVENRGEPGGGPFWVEDADGFPTRQIVEKAQIDAADPGQAEILARSTHFNPVDLVCALRNRRGRPYDLSRHVDPRTAFVTAKSLEGRRLLALERPGLWNGAMAGWNTLFVEVPAETFAPVKTVLDLLAPEHRG